MRLPQMVCLHGVLTCACDVRNRHRLPQQLCMLEEPVGRCWSQASLCGVTSTALFFAWRAAHIRGCNCCVEGSKCGGTWLLRLAA